MRHVVHVNITTHIHTAFATKSVTFQHNPGFLYNTVILMILHQVSIVVVPYAWIPYVFKNKQMHGEEVTLLQDESRSLQLKTALCLRRAYVPNCKQLNYHSRV